MESNYPWTKIDVTVSLVQCLLGTVSPWNKVSLEQCLPWNNVSLEQCLLGTVSPWNNVSLGAMSPWNNVSLEQSLLGTMSPWNKVSSEECPLEQGPLEQSLLGTVSLGTMWQHPYMYKGLNNLYK